MVSDKQLRATRPERPRSTSISEMAGWLGVERPDEDAEVTGISLSSHRVLPGDLYVALPGARAHGASYAASAVDSGAVAVLTDPSGKELVAGLDVPVLVVDDLRPRLGRLAARLHGHPTEQMKMIAVTGTQGKTTTTRLAEEALAGAGVHAAVIGTVGTRVDGVVFDVAVFTNLGRDHLDFHKDVEDYFAAKASLFIPERARLGLVNLDDEFGRRLLVDPTIPMRTFALHDTSADWHVIDIDLAPDGSSFTVIGPGGVEVRTSVPIPGDFNVANALAAIAACAETGHDVEAVAAALAQGAGVPGRLEQVAVPGGFSVVVDYAHKPDAVEAALNTLRPLTEGRLTIVIGAGGDRDTGKRPVMGEIAARLADLVVVTDDNPRSEDPASIRAEVLAGTSDGNAEVIEVGNRREAIREALRRAAFGDIVLVAGKGHETGQEVDGVVHPFDDRAVVREEAVR